MEPLDKRGSSMKYVLSVIMFIELVKQHYKKYCEKMKS